ncbi:MAG: SDR family oxidoreductase [Proteobacteria bacterium]|nr:SDR family oxidoreductase [Pseudomonadota bacterium]
MLVTGGAGFIGSHLTEHLLLDGHEVHVIDDFSTGRRENLANLRGNTPPHIHPLSICDRGRLEPLFKDVDHVYHLAALADIVPSIERPDDYMEANVVGTLRVLQAARKASVPRLVYAASSSCYGMATELPTPETAACRPEYPYALSKYLGEQIVLHWAHVYGVPALSLRLFNVYGTRSRTHGSYGAMFGVFLAQKIAGQPYTIVGDGRQRRDFTHVSDVVRALVMAAKSQLCGQALNVGTGAPVSVNRIVELLGGDAVHIPKRPGEPECTQADVSKIRSLLGWRARVSIEQGVASLLKNIELWRESPVWTPDSIEEATRSWFACLARAGAPVRPARVQGALEATERLRANDARGQA